MSLGVSMFDELRRVVDAGKLGGYGLLASLDDDTINYLATPGTGPRANFLQIGAGCSALHSPCRPRSSNPSASKAQTRLAKDMPRVVGEDLDFEVEQLWAETVHPALLGLEDEMADHGLVREIALSRRGSSRPLPAGLQTVALEALRTRREGQSGPRASEFYYFYEANRRMARP